MKFKLFILLFFSALISFGQSTNVPKTLFATGTNVYAVTETSPVGYSVLEKWIIQFDNANTLTGSSVTLNRASQGAKVIKNVGNVDLAAGDIKANYPYFLSYNGTNFLIVGSPSEVTDAIVDGITTKAPSQNAVFDALALKQPLNTKLTAIAALANGTGALTNDGSGNYSYAPAGTGSVTTVSVATANGVSGSVANATTTPAITLTLGAIVPTSVNGVALSGSATPTLAVSGTTAVSGTNTGDQTTITGNAGTATTLQTGRTISVAGDATGTSASFNGSANASVTVNVAKINGTALSGLATGILKNTTSTGVPSIAVGSDLPTMTATVGGAVPTPPNNTTTFLRGDGTFAAPTASASWSSVVPSLSTQTSNYTLVLADKDKIIEMNLAGANTTTVPPNSSVAFAIGTQITVVQYGAGLTTIVQGAGVSINTSSGSLTSPGQNAPMVLEKRATDEWYLWNGVPGFTNPMTTAGDLIQGASAGSAVRLAGVTTGNALISGGVATANSWGKITSGHVDGTVLTNTTGWLTAGASALTSNSSQTGAFKNSFALNGVEINQNVQTSSWINALKITPGNSTGLTANTSFPLGLTIEPFTLQWVTSAAFTNQMFNYIKSPTAAFTVSSTITNGYNFYIDPPLPGTNATITNPYALGVNGSSNFLGSIKGTTATFATSVSTGTVQMDATGFAGNNFRRLSNATMVFTGDPTSSNMYTMAGVSSQTATSGTFITLNVNPNSAHASGNANQTLIATQGTQNSLSTGTLKLFDASPNIAGWGGNVVGFSYAPSANVITGNEYSFQSTSGVFSLPSTVTTTGTTGNQTINKQCGTVNIAAAGTTVTVTNSLVTSNSIISVVPRTNDATAYVKNYVPGSGSFVINLGAAATSEVSIGFCIITK